MIKTEIIAVGDELCYGRVYDTNSYWLADQLTRLGAIVQRIICLRDNEEEICKTILESIKRGSFFVFISGGLGPTNDDKTLISLSKISGKPIIIPENIIQFIKEHRNISKEKFLPHQINMIKSIKDAECLPNPIGWSPVTILKIEKSTIFALPGPPKELQACFKEHLSHLIKINTGLRSYAKRIFITMYESELIPIINEIYKNVDGIYLKPLVGEGNRELGIGVEVIAFDYTEDSCFNKYQKTLKIFKDLVFQKGRKIID